MQTEEQVREEVERFQALYNKLLASVSNVLNLEFESMLKRLNVPENSDIIKLNFAKSYLSDDVKQIFIKLILEQLGTRDD